jgi:hypothetical protein
LGWFICICLTFFCGNTFLTMGIMSVSRSGGAWH